MTMIDSRKKSFAMRGIKDRCDGHQNSDIEDLMTPYHNKRRYSKKQVLPKIESQRDEIKMDLS